MAESPTLSILRSLQAETMLAGFGMMKVLKDIRPSMVYKEKQLSEHFDDLQVAISQIGWMKLRPRVDITTASEYLVELATNYERLLDGLNRCTMDAQNLRARCKTIRAKITTMQDPFHVLWSIGASEMTTGVAGLKNVKDKDWKALAGMEFTAIVEEADQELDAMIEALDTTLDNLKTMRRTSADTYAIGKDQVNAALSDLDQQDHGIGEGTGQVKQRSGIAALTGLFGDRVKGAQVGTQVQEVDDDLPEEVTVGDQPAETPAPGTEANGVGKPGQGLHPEKGWVDPEEKPEPPKDEKPKTSAPRRERKGKDLTPTVTVVPVEPAAEQAPVPAATPVEAIQQDPFISPAQKEEILKKVDPQASKQEEDDFPGETAASPAPKPEEDDFPDLGAQATTDPVPAPEEAEDDFPTSAEVINMTPANKELAAGTTPEPTPTPEPPKEDKPKGRAEAKPKAQEPAPTPEPPKEDKPRKTGGLFRPRTDVLPPNQQAAPAFKPTVTATATEGLEEFM